MLAPLFAIAVLHWAVLIIPGFNFILIGQLAAGGNWVTAMAAVAAHLADTPTAGLENGRPTWRRSTAQHFDADLQKWFDTRAAG